MPIYVLEPPVRFNHPYSGSVIERVLPLAEARRACAHMGVHADACSWEVKGKCFLVVPRGGPVAGISPLTSVTSALTATAGGRITASEIISGSENDSIDRRRRITFF